METGAEEGVEVADGGEVADFAGFDGDAEDLVEFEGGFGEGEGVEGEVLAEARGVGDVGERAAGGLGEVEFEDGEEAGAEAGGVGTGFEGDDGFDGGRGEAAQFLADFGFGAAFEAFGDFHESTMPERGREGDIGF